MSTPLSSPDRGARRFCGRLEQEILAQAARTPVAIAFRGPNGPVSYEEMVSVARRVASRLRDRGVAPGDRVAVLCQRGGEGLIGAIGVLLAGGVYVPVSPGYPPTRIEHVVETSESRAILVDSACSVIAGRLAGDTRSICLEDMIASGGNSLNPLPAVLDPSGPAYILFTSGSSGRPKGVVVGHDALLNTLSWMADAFGLVLGDAVAQKTSWGFTDSLWELFLPLLVGGEVAFVDDATVRDPLLLYQVLRDSRATITQFVPAALSLFLAEVCGAIERPSLPNLRWILNGGEELPRGLVDRWFATFPGVGFANSYGMTESAIYATCYYMREPPAFGLRRIPVGRAIPGARVYVLSSGGEPLTEDHVGEICIGGGGVMDGYCGEPNLTSAVFTRHPTSGERLYRTGDLGAWRYDGDLAYLGRADRQLKIRGMRVEPGEVEHVLLRHPGVQHAAVIASGEGETRKLLAFYSARSVDPGEEALLVHLRASLPDYMVPSRCVLLDAMPLTVHAKVDRAALAKLPVAGPGNPAREVPSPGSIEETVSAVWQEVLKHGEFDLDQGFFAAGGNSLLLVRLHSALPEEYRRALALADLVRYPTVRSLAERLRTLVLDRPPCSEPGNAEGNRSRQALEAGRARRRGPEESHD